MLLSFCARFPKHRYALGAETDKGSRSHTLCFWSQNSPKERAVEPVGKGGVGQLLRQPSPRGSRGELGGTAGPRGEVRLRGLLRPEAPPFTFPQPSPPWVTGFGISVGVSRASRLRVRQFWGQTNHSRRRRF